MHKPFNKLSSLSETCMKHFLTIAAILCCGSVIVSAQNTTVSGTLTATGGKPIKIAHVHVSNSNSAKAKAVSYDVKPDGTFSFSLPNGWHRLQFSGVDYSPTPMFPMEVYCSGELVKVSTQLAANSTPKVVDSVKIITDLVDYNFDKAIAMTKNNDGTFSTEIKTDKPKLGYQVLVYGGEAKDLHSVNGTMADSYEYDGGGDYRSIIQTNNGIAKIVFDPKKLPESNGQSAIEFKDSFSKSVQTILEQGNADRQEFFTAYSKRKAGKPESYNPTAAHEKVRDLIVAEKDQRVKELLMLRYLAVGYFSDDTTGADPQLVKKILSTIEPSSPVWGHEPGLISTAVKLSGEKNDEYLQKALKENSSPYVQSELLSILLQKASKDKKSALINQYYKQLMSTYPESFAARFAEKQFNPDRKIQVGNEIPKFAFDAIDSAPGSKVTRDEFKGKWVLIDNWATWCGPCIAELPEIHKIYEKFKDKNFVVLSVSFDREAGDVTKFRKGKFKMPWMHVFSEGVWESEAAKAFEVIGIPKPILIDPNGKIVALEEDLRSDKLEKTLEQFVR